MKSKMTVRFLLVLSAVGLAAESGCRAKGQAQLGVDQRNRPCRPDFGFAYYVPDTVQGGATDVCTTLANSGNHTLTATDGVASPENPEPILQRVGLNGQVLQADAVTFEGRTGDCYYMVTGVYAGQGGQGSQGGEGGDEEAERTSDFDSSQTPHFVLYINQRYNSEDDNVTLDEVSTVSVELANPANSNPIHFRLSQQTLSGSGLVQILQDDGVTPEPIRSDGKTERTYQI
jgi:hypothetical protein